MNEGDFMILGCNVDEENKEALYGQLRDSVARIAQDTSVFDVPKNMRYGSFDDLIKLVDDLGKFDTQCEAVIKRIINVSSEIDVETPLHIIYNKHAFTVSQYIKRFTWDDTKFPRSRQLKDNTQLLMQAIHNIDAELRLKVASFNELKSGERSMVKGQNVSLTHRDLNDVLTPDVMKNRELIETERLTTLFVVVPRGHESNWESCYEKLHPFVVPRSSKVIEGISDREGNTLFTVVIFKSFREEFANASKANKYIVRDYSYSPEVYSRLMQQKNIVMQEKSRQREFLSRIFAASFSEAFVSWLHLKAMRIFVESTLRYGLPPKFASFVIKYDSSKKRKKLLKELNSVLTPKSLFGKSYIENKYFDEGEEEYFPYVLLDIILFPKI